MINMKIKYIVSIVSILVVVVFVYYISLSKQKPNELNSLTPESGQQINESKTKVVWETYQSDLYNFSFEYKKGDFVGVNDEPTELYFSNFMNNSEQVNDDPTERYLSIREFDPNSREISDTSISSEYWIEFIVHKKNSDSEITSCNKMVVDYTQSDFEGYKVYKSSKLVGGEIFVTEQTACFERPNYNLVVHGTDFNDSGDNVLDHLISSIKFAN